MKKINLILTCLYLSFAPPLVFGLSDTELLQFAIVDQDGDGLIEIDNLRALNEIRNNIGGEALFNSSKGCPERGCVGFELTRDLDFDTNGDGKVDYRDDYWNGGEGWRPISRMNVIFEGHNHTIKNLYINRQSKRPAGLFEASGGGTIRNLRVSGSIRGDSTIGGLVGLLERGEIENCVSSVDVYSSASSAGGLVGTSKNSSITGSSASGNIGGDVAVGGLIGSSQNLLIINNSSSASVTSGSEVGGLVGTVHDSTIEENVVTGNVEGFNVGGLVGFIADSELINNYSTNRVRGDRTAGGLIGILSLGNIISNNYTVSAVTPSSSGPEYVAVGALVGVGSGSDLNGNYWAIDTGGVVDESIAGGATLADLKCATSANNNTCADIILYDGWDRSVWDFGNSNELPRLRTTSNFPWTSRDTPNASGDHEGTRHLKKEYPERYCDNPIAIEAHVDGDRNIYRAEANRVFDYFNVLQGLACDKTKQPNGKCDDYEVSYLCSQGWSSWHNNDTPNGSGDYEKRDDVQACESPEEEPRGIRARKINSNDIFYGTPDKLKHFSTTKGLGCNNKDQEKFKFSGCNDYKVRLVCPTLSEV